MGSGVRLGVFALRLGGFFAILAAGAWAVVAAFGTDQLAVAGWLSFSWTISVIAIAVVVGLRLRPLIGVVGIVAGLWSASFAIRIATEPASEIGEAFGNFWFVMPLIGLFVAGLSGTGTSPRLIRFGRALAVLWFVGSVMWLSFDELGGPITALSERAMRVVVIQWLGLAGFAVWALWSAGRFATDALTPREPTVRAPDRASDADVLRGWTPYGPWPRRLARVTAVATALLVIPVVLDRLAGQANLRVETFELVFGLSIAILALVLGNTTPRLGHTQVEALSAIPHVGIAFGLTEPGVFGGLIVAVIDDGIQTDVPDFTGLVGFALIGWWVGRIASRQRPESRPLGLLTGVGLIVGGAWAVAVAQAGGNVSGPGIVLAIAMSMLVAWTWQLGTMLAPGIARPVDVLRCQASAPEPGHRFRRGWRRGGRRDRRLAPRARPGSISTSSRGAPG